MHKYDGTRVGRPVLKTGFFEKTGSKKTGSNKTGSKKTGLKTGFKPVSNQFFRIFFILFLSVKNMSPIFF